MSTLLQRISLTTVLTIDAVVCAATGALMTVLAGPITELTAIPRSLLFCAGLSLFPIALFMAFVATRRASRRSLVSAIVIGNVAWILGSLYLLVSSAIDPNGLGIAFIVVQAAVVADLTWMEWRGLEAPLSENWAA